MTDDERLNLEGELQNLKNEFASKKTRLKAIGQGVQKAGERLKKAEQLVSLCREKKAELLGMLTTSALPLVDWKANQSMLEQNEVHVIEENNEILAMNHHTADIAETLAELKAHLEEVERALTAEAEIIPFPNAR